MAQTTAKSGLQFAGLSDTGMERSNNQDSFGYYIPNKNQQRNGMPSLFIVSDGMGGYSQGDMASKSAVEMFINYFVETDGNTDIRNLEQIVHNINKSIFDYSATQEEQLMGTTLSALILNKSRAYTVQVGDSRIYLIRDDRIEQITRDHTVIDEMIRQGSMTPEEAKTKNFKHLLTRSLGIKEEVDPDINYFPLRDGDLFVLCSDGLHNYLDDEEIKAIALSKSPSNAAAEMIQTANERGGSDNITVQVVKYQKSKDFRPLMLSSIVIMLSLLMALILFWPPDKIELRPPPTGGTGIPSSVTPSPSPKVEKGTLLIDGKTGADEVVICPLLNDGKTGNELKLDKKKEKEEIVFVSQKLNVGNYRISFFRDGYCTITEDIKITKGKNKYPSGKKDALDWKELPYLIVKTNVDVKVTIKSVDSPDKKITDKKKTVDGMIKEQVEPGRYKIFIVGKAGYKIEGVSPGTVEVKYESKIVSLIFKKIKQPIPPIIELPDNKPIVHIEETYIPQSPVSKKNQTPDPGAKSGEKKTGKTEPKHEPTDSSSPVNNSDKYDTKDLPIDNSIDKPDKTDDGIKNESNTDSGKTNKPDNFENFNNLDPK